MNLQEILKIGEVFNENEKHKKELSVAYDIISEIFHDNLKKKYKEFFLDLDKLRALDLETGKDKFWIDSYLNSIFSKDEFINDIKECYNESLISKDSNEYFYAFFSQQQHRFVNKMKDFDLLKCNLSEYILELIEKK